MIKLINRIYGRTENIPSMAGMVKRDGKRISVMFTSHKCYSTSLK